MSSPQDPPQRSLAAAGSPASGLQLLQGALIIIAVLYFARELLVPLALAILLSFVLAPVARVFRRFSVPRVPAVLLAALLGLLVMLGVAGLMAQQASTLAQNLPTYQATITNKLAGLRSAGGLLERMNSALEEFQRDVREQEGPPGDIAPPAPQVTPMTTGARQAPMPVEIHTPPPTAFETLRGVLEPLLGPLALGGIVLILVIFILLYREDLRDRVIRLIGSRDLHRTMAAMDDAAYRLSRYFLAQVAMNSVYGLFMTAALWLIGIPNPLLWGFITGLMRFVPFIGGWIAVAFPALLALAVDPGWTTLVWVLLLYTASELAMGQVFEPWIFGHSTGLSPIAVIAAATFWTWLWGPVGLLLSVPLTVCLVVLGRHVDRLEFLEVMLGDQPALDPEEFFYQRALAGDVDALAEQSERQLQEKSLAGYMDAVALPALRLAQADAARGTLSAARLEALRRSVRTLLEDLEEEDSAVEDTEQAPLPAAWQEPGAVVCTPGRGAFDGLLAAMLVQVLLRRGFGVQQGTAGGSGLAGSANAAVVPAEGTAPRLVCLCLIEGGSSTATARYLLRRTRRRLAGAPVLALTWQPNGEGRLAAALRSEGGAPALTLAMTLAEAVKLATEAAVTMPEAPESTVGETGPARAMGAAPAAS